MKKKPTLLLVDSDRGAALELEKALHEIQTPWNVVQVQNVNELGQHIKRARPSLILLGVGNSSKNGLEILRHVKNHPGLKSTPVVFLNAPTPSSSSDDIDTAYRLGASSYICKPSSYDELLELTRSFSRYWAEVVELPTPSPS